MKIKNVNFNDLDTIVSLEQETFNKNAFSKNFMKKLINDNLFFLKLEHNKFKAEIIGFIIVIQENLIANIINFLIKTKFRNRGYGTYLLEKTIEKIKKKKKIQKVILNVQENNFIAIKLYEKLNFKKNPKKLECYYNSGENAYLMELDISSTQTKTYK